MQGRFTCWKYNNPAVIRVSAAPCLEQPSPFLRGSAFGSERRELCSALLSPLARQGLGLDGPEARGRKGARPAGVFRTPYVHVG